MTTPALYDYLERLCNLLRVQARVSGSAFGLQPVQLEALRYLDSCNRFSDNPQAVADYLGHTKGTVSQTVKVLESKGMLSKVPDTSDRRVVHLRITKEGRRAVADSVPTPALRAALASLSDNERERLGDGLQALLLAMQQANALRTFATCVTCRFNRKTPEGRVCGLTGERLLDTDLLRICREHEYPRE